MKAPHYLPGAVKEAIGYGANALMIYLGAPQNSLRQNLSILKLDEFKTLLKENNISIANVIVHGSYLLNLANTTKKSVFHFSTEFLKTEIERMEEIGLETIVLHPGSSLGAATETSLLQVVEGLNLVIKENSKVRIALETMSGKINGLGINFEQLKFIIDKTNLKEKIGVCWDTCHLYSAGYDIKNKLEEVIKDFDGIIGLEKLWVIHVNDSKFELGSRKDRHENIGYGKIGFDALKRIVWHPKLEKIVKILETPKKRECYHEEIRILKKT